jgi:hypothetical protein
MMLDFLQMLVCMLKADNNCKFIILQLGDSFLSKIVIGADSDTVIMPDKP